MSTNDDTTTEEAEQFEGRDEDALVETRRNAAKLFAGIAGSAAIGAFAVNGLTGIDSAAIEDAGRELTYETIYVKGTHLVDSEGKRVGVDALEPGSGDVMTVFPEKEGGGALEAKTAATMLMRFTQDAYKTPTKLDWTVQGYAAYSKVCTHAGCLVGPAGSGQNLTCPCHQSVFNPLEGCTVVSGPAPRPLPQLPIGVTEEGDLLVATGHFEAPIGAGE